MVLTVIMGLRQLYPERSLDTKIPFITGPLLIPFQILPQLYLAGYYLTCFALELAPSTYYDLQMPFALYFSWFYLRFLMQGEVVGEPGAHFALQTFFPEAYRPKIAELSDSVFQTVNESTGAFDYIQRKFKSPLQNTSGVDRKKYCSLNLKQL